MRRSCLPLLVMLFACAAHNAAAAGAATTSSDSSLALFQKACEGGSGDGCENLGNLYALGQGVDKNIAKAAELYTHGCELGGAGACNEVGVLRLNAGDVAAAVQLFQKSCEGGSSLGCSNLGAQYLSGSGIAKDLQAA